LRRLRYVENILWFAFQILALTGGPMLGVFLLGLLTRHRANRANIPAMLISTTVCTVLLVLIQYGRLHLGWTWLIVIGTAITMSLSYLFGRAAHVLCASPKGRTT
jgi:Na+/proline symporter